jgi:hypothetical protein
MPSIQRGYGQVVLFASDVPGTPNLILALEGSKRTQKWDAAWIVFGDVGGQYYYPLAFRNDAWKQGSWQNLAYRGATPCLMSMNFIGGTPFLIDSPGRPASMGYLSGDFSGNISLGDRATLNYSVGGVSCFSESIGDLIREAFSIEPALPDTLYAGGPISKGGGV